MNFYQKKSKKTFGWQKVKSYTIKTIDIARQKMDKKDWNVSRIDFSSDEIKYTIFGDIWLSFSVWYYAGLWTTCSKKTEGSIFLDTYKGEIKDSCTCAFKPLHKYCQTFKYDRGAAFPSLELISQDGTGWFEPVIYFDDAKASLHHLYTNDEVNLALGIVSFTICYCIKSYNYSYLFKVRHSKKQNKIFLTPIKKITELDKFTIQQCIFVPNSGKIVVLTEGGKIIFIEQDKYDRSELSKFQNYYDVNFKYNNINNF